MVPIPIEGETTIAVAFLADQFLALLGDFALILVVLLISVAAILSVIVYIITLMDPKKVNPDSFFGSLFRVNLFWTIVRVLAMVFVLFTYFNVGWEAVYSGATGSMILNDLLVFLIAVFLVAGLLLPLLLNFGLLEFVGALLTKVMRPVFTLPGRSTVDNLASWLGDGTIGVLLTSKQYEDGYYTKREAAVIGTTFSVVSITFTIAIVRQVDLMHMFLPLYGTVVLAGFVAAVIMPRIPPLSKFSDTYLKEDQEPLDESIPKNYTAITWGYKQAVDRASKAPNLINYLKIGIKNVLDMWIGVLPIVMAIGTLGVIVAEFTPFFTWIGTPFVPILEVLQVPEAKAAAETLLVGFTDMFLPAIIIEGVANDMTRFVVAALSVTQLIYLSEVGGVLLASKVPVNFWHLLVIFLMRTAITLPIIVGIAHLIF
ncbi:YjiH family protein [Allobacillus sp. SKP2-8]|uniref:YjiH family protein n=2 Tax=Bacillaceae TaxID=186817 RepID=A0ABS6GKX6_9BACI|nr:YjiH family protein [Allobacillus halotolerans]TSJ68041.1 YjiH family protein [Allobacillus sp. SKP2-8]